MNCKPGDLAVVRPGVVTPGLLGRVVTVIRVAIPGERFPLEVGHMRFNPKYVGLAWVCESSSLLPWISKKGVIHQMRQRPIADAYLRPIRDNDGEDEMLRIAGKPQEKETV